MNSIQNLFPTGWVWACAGLAALAPLGSVQGEAPFDTHQIEQLTGLKGTWNEKEKVFKVSAPRKDVPVSVDQWQMPAFMGLTSWVAFTPGEKQQLMAMGDLVLFQDEVNPAMSVALAGHLNVTALHNHFFFDHPKVYFMHVGGEGSLEQLAEAVGQVLAKVKAIRAAQAEPATAFAGQGLPRASSITAHPIEEILGAKGQSNQGMFKLVFGRDAKMACGCEVGKEMGVNTWAAFAGADENAVVDGDFAVHEAELQPVLRALRAAGINIVAIHHHMLGETPRTLFLHYWGRGSTASLARGLKQAIEAQTAAK